MQRSIQKLTDHYQTIYARLHRTGIEYATLQIPYSSALDRVSRAKSEAHGIFIGVDAMAPPGYSEEMILCSEWIARIGEKAKVIEGRINRDINKEHAK